MGAAVLALSAGAGIARAENPQIAGLQVALRAHAVYTGGIDGVAGPGTVAAVRLFQARQGLAVDGRAGKRTRTALGTARPPVARPARPRAGRSRPRRLGAPVPASRARVLLGRAHGRLHCRDDRGRQVVPGAHGLVADGIAGRATIAALASQGVPVARRQTAARVPRRPRRREPDRDRRALPDECCCARPREPPRPGPRIARRNPAPASGYRRCARRGGPAGAGPPDGVGGDVRGARRRQPDGDCSAAWDLSPHWPATTTSIHAASC